MKTVREVSEELGISRQAVYSKLTVNFKEKFTTIESINNRDTLVISKAGVDKLKEDIVKVDSQVDSQVDNVIDTEIIDLLSKNIDLLQEQLKIKDNQIVELNERLKEQQELNRNNQVLLLNEKKKVLESVEQKEGRSIVDKIKSIFR